jgi:ATP-dependent Clp protease protease subunit
MKASTTPFWRFEAAATDGGPPRLYLYGPIAEATWLDDATTPMAFKADLDALGTVDELHLHVNSPGGDVFAGQAIYSMLYHHPARIVGHVDGAAASIASLVLMAANHIVMPANATMMVHSPWTVAMGNARELRRTADALEQAGEGMVAAYTARTGKEADEIRALLDAETWMTAAKAKELGFADEVEELTRVQACLRDDGQWDINGQVMDLSGFREQPTWMLAEAKDTSAAPSIGGTDADAEEIERRTRIVTVLQMKGGTR